MDEYATVDVAFELSKPKWKLGVMLLGSTKMSSYDSGGRLDGAGGTFCGGAHEGCAAMTLQKWFGYDQNTL
jgi:hypothetical protein